MKAKDDLEELQEYNGFSAWDDYLEWQYEDYITGKLGEQND